MKLITPSQKLRNMNYDHQVIKNDPLTWTKVEVVWILFSSFNPNPYCKSCNVKKYFASLQIECVHDKSRLADAIQPKSDLEIYLRDSKSILIVIMFLFLDRSYFV